MDTNANSRIPDGEVAARRTAWDIVARLLMFLLATIQLVSGMVGLHGIYMYAVEPKTNPAREEILLLPLGAFYGSLPFLLLTAILYRSCRRQLSLVERSLVHVGCVLPVVAFGSIFVVGYEGRWSAALLALYYVSLLVGTIIAAVLSLGSLRQEGRWRFSLRAALVAMTVLAMMAGLVGIVMRSGK
jgi:hypothetical protein